MKKKLTWEALLLISTALYNFLVFFGGRQIAQEFPHYDLSVSFDNIIPLLPWTIFIYVGAFLFWIVNYCLAALYDESGHHRFIVSHFIGETFCLLAFVLLPTTKKRPAITGVSLSDTILNFVYMIDRPDNLMPSIHCFVSWLCWIGVRKNPHIPRQYQLVSLLTAVAICFSTLTVKQHVLADVAAGIFLAEASYIMAGFAI